MLLAIVIPRTREILMSIATKLKELRLRKAMSLQAVADAVGASKAHIWDLETERAKNPTIELLVKLSRCFDVSVAEIIGENPDGEDESTEMTAMYRDLKDLTDQDRETIKMMMERLKDRNP
jgi:transcriptional regulator with XRE-family HTH domain